MPIVKDALEFSPQDVRLSVCHHDMVTMLHESMADWNSHGIRPHPPEFTRVTLRIGVRQFLQLKIERLLSIP
jgi:hypothetical protein